MKKNIIKKTLVFASAFVLSLNVLQINKKEVHADNRATNIASSKYDLSNSMDTKIDLDSSLGFYKTTYNEGILIDKSYNEISVSNSIEVKNSITNEINNYQTLKTFQTINNNVNNTYITNQVKKEKTWLQEGNAKAKKFTSYEKTMSTIIDDVFKIIEDPHNVDYNTMITDVVTSGINCLASCYGLGEVSKSLLTGLRNFGGEKQPTEIGQLREHIDEQFGKVNENLAEIKGDVAKINDALDKQTSKIINEMANALEDYYARTQIIEFMSKTKGNFSYDIFKNYLYGSSDYSSKYRSQAYYSLLIDSIVSGAPSSTIKKNYDNLYSALCATTAGSMQDSALNTFYEYLMGNDKSSDLSIIRYYYDYLVANSKFLGGRNAEYEAIEFANELYNVALFADYCITMCNVYQKAQILAQYGQDARLDSEYVIDNQFGLTTITLGEINENIERISQEEEKLRENIVSDICYIMHMSESYVVKDLDGAYRITSKNDEDTYSKLLDGQTIYLNQFPDYLANKFDVNVSDFSYKYVRGEIEQTSNGVFKVLDYDNSYVNYYYKNKYLYSIALDFNEHDFFSGGDGSSSNPYIIHNVEQFKLINSDEKYLEKNYKLIGDIDFSSTNFYPLGDEDNPFTGTFDGNGYTIKNISYTGNEACGIFANNQGEIKNLIVDNCSFNISISNETNFLAGIITNKNQGLIYNCDIKNCDFALSYENTKTNQCMSSYTGLVTGINSGEIEYVSISNCNIESILFKKYSGTEDTKNKVENNVSGMVGYMMDNSSLKKCKIDENSTISGVTKIYTTSILVINFPRFGTYMGGTAAKVGKNVKFEDLYTALSLDNITYSEELKNTSTIGQDPTSFNRDWEKSILDVSKNDKKYKLDDPNKIVFPSKQSSNTYSYDFLGNKSEDNPNYYEDQIYDCGNNYFKYGNLQINNNGIPVDAVIISIYGLDTKNSSEHEVVEGTATILFMEASGNNVHYGTIDIPYIVKPNKVVAVYTTLTGSYNIEKNTQAQFNEGICYAIYQDGTTKDIASFATYSDTSSLPYGQHEATVSYGGINHQFDLLVVCTNENYVLDHIVEPTCTEVGYSVFKCSNCGNEIKTSYVDKINHQHTIVVKENEIIASCTTNGQYDEVIYCVDCGIELDRDTITLPMLSHNFVDDVSNDTSHTCSKCGKVENHNYSAIENQEKIIYVCQECGHTHEENNSREVIANLPRVYISDGYILTSSKEVKVFVEIQNNPGICGATFSINYPEGFSLIGWKHGNVLPNAIISKGLNNDTFTLTQVELDNNSGIILELTLSVPNSKNIGDIFNIDISYSRSAKMFSGKNSEAINKDIITYGGSITTVAHLPGDINDDDKVDVLDATLLSRKISNINDTTYNEKFADVNLDGSVDIDDLTTLLKYLAGGYDAIINNNEYKIILNTNDGSANLNSINVALYDENGNKNKYSLPTYSRQGYKFVGWYNSFDYSGSPIENGTDIKFNENQVKQTLYAKYEANEIILNSNYGFIDNSNDEYDITYTTNNYSYYDGTYLTLTNPFKKSTIVTYYEKTSSTVEKMTYNFLGWSTSPNGSVTYSSSTKLNLKDGSMGKVTLYAIWDTKKVVNKSSSAYGYNFDGWYTNSSYITPYDFNSNTNAKNVELYGKYSVKTYAIIYNSGLDASEVTGKTTDSTTIAGKRNIENEYALAECKFEVDGYNFNHWVDENGNTYADQEKIKYIDVNGDGVVTLTAVWTPKVFTISLISNNGEMDGNTVVPTIGGTDKIYVKYKDGIYSDEQCTNNITQIPSLPQSLYYNFNNYSLNGITYINSDGTINDTLKNVTSSKDLSISWKAKYLVFKYASRSSSGSTTTFNYDKNMVDYYYNVKGIKKVILTIDWEYESFAMSSTISPTFTYGVGTYSNSNTLSVTGEEIDWSPMDGYTYRYSSTFTVTIELKNFLNSDSYSIFTIKSGTYPGKFSIDTFQLVS